MAKRKGSTKLSDKTLTMRADLRLQQGEGDKRPTFEIEAYTGGAINPDRPYLDAPLVIDLSTASSIQRIAAILDHDDTQIVGQTNSVTVAAKSVTMLGVITGDYTRPGEPAEKVVTHSRNGFVWPVSPGGDIGSLDYVDAGSSERVNGKTFRGPVYIARNVTFRHISFLSDPADQSAQAAIAAKAGSTQETQDMDFNEWLEGLGFEDVEAIEAGQLKKLKAKYKAERKAEQKLEAERAKNAGNGDEQPPPEPKRALRSKRESPLAEAKARRERNDALNTLAAKYGDDYPDAIETIEDHLEAARKDETLTVQDFENLLLREATRHDRIDNRPKRGRDNGIVDNRVLEVALCRAGGMLDKSLAAKFKPEELEASDRQFRHGLSVCEFLELTARAHGFTGSFRSSTPEVLASAFPDPRLRMASGPSTYDVSGILSNVLNKFLVDYFMGVDMSAMNMISATRPVRDFRQITSYSLTGDLTYSKVEPGGEIKHGTFGETSYTNQADTYGKMLAIDRRDLVNDDLGALTRVAQRLGRGGAMALLDVFWTVFVNNSTFFTTARGNLDEGADTALSLTSLTLAKTLFDKLTDPDGKPMNHVPRILLVPPELEATAKTIINSQLLIMAGTEDPSVTQGNANIHAGTLEVAKARELSNSNYTGYSTLKWYMLAAPTDVPVIESCFLNGRTMPIIENAQADFDTLGIKMRGYFDFGVAMQEYRGGVAMKGEA